jgi:hypothetical protein
MLDSSDGARDMWLHQAARTMDGNTDADTRDCTDQDAVWVDSRAAEPRELGCGEVSGVPAIQGRKLGAEKAATAKEK